VRVREAFRSSSEGYPRIEQGDVGVVSSFKTDGAAQIKFEAAGLKTVAKSCFPKLDMLAPQAVADASPSLAPVAARTLHKPAPSTAGAPAEVAVPAVTLSQLRGLLQDYSANMLAEVHQLLLQPDSSPPSEAPWASTETLDMQLLASTLVDRDRQVRQLEEQLAGLQAELAHKEQRVAHFDEELAEATRLLRHRQLDLELQQLRLEERVRSNAELEQAQRTLSTRVEEVHWSARHAAIDLQLAPMTPRSLRAQGSLPWMMRKTRSPGAASAEAAWPHT